MGWRLSCEGGVPPVVDACEDGGDFGVFCLATTAEEFSPPLAEPPPPPPSPISSSSRPDTSGVEEAARLRCLRPLLLPDFRFDAEELEEEELLELEVELPLELEPE